MPVEGIERNIPMLLLFRLLEASQFDLIQRLHRLHTRLIIGRRPGTLVYQVMSLAALLTNFTNHSAVLPHKGYGEA